MLNVHRGQQARPQSTGGTSKAAASATYKLKQIRRLAEDMQPSQAWPAHAHDTRDLCAESTESPTQPGSHGPGCPPPVALTPGPPASPPAERSRISLSSDLGGHPLRPTPTGTCHGSQAHRGHGGAEGRGTEGATFQLSSTQFSLSAMSNSLRSQGLQHARPPCPSPTPGAYSNPCSFSR